MQYGFYFDNSRCTGCRTCEMACKDYKDLDADTAFRHVYDYEGGTWTEIGNGLYEQNCFSYHLSISCQHCDDPACTSVCPTGAMHKDADTGLVSVDTERCIGCGYCHMACPYNAPKVDRDKGHSVKCDGCQDRVAAGLRPICVESCPLRALDFGDIEELRATYEGTDAIAPMPEAHYTNPNIVIKPCVDAEKAGEGTGRVGNLLEVM